jgi:hypothetical protein
MRKLLQDEVSVFVRQPGYGVDKACRRHQKVVIPDGEDASDVVDELRNLREGRSGVTMSSKIPKSKK